MSLSKTNGAVLVLLTAVPIVASSLPSRRPDDQKLKIEELVSRHLEAIGSPDARSAAKTRVINGSVNLVSRLGRAGNLNGKGVLVSAGPKLRYTMRFPIPDYPAEWMLFDGTRAETSILPNGQRSNLSQFLSQQTAPLKEGLLGGVLTTAWALQRLDQLQPKLEYRGQKKVDGRPLHEVSYRQKKGSPDLKIALFFDPATFRHVRSEYKFQVGARLGVGPNDSTRIQESYYVLAEDFDDFVAVDGLMLPRKYKIQLSITTSAGSVLYDYVLQVDQLSHKEQFGDEVFKAN
jgi:hypothetical protein